MTRTAICPSCIQTVDVGDDPKLNQLVTCQKCGVVTEIYWLDPVELDWPMSKQDSHKTEYDRELDFEYEY